MPKRYEEREMPFLDHLEELRWRIIRALIAIIIGAIVGFIFAKPIINLLIWPTSQLDPPIQLQVLKIQGMFIITLEVGFFAGIILSLPYILFQFWQFIAPGLLPNEKKYFPQLITSATLLFLAGLSFAYFIILPFAIDFFVGLAPPSIAANIAIDFYIGFILRILFLFGLIFELPVLSYFLAKIGLVTPMLMKKYRRHSIVVIFIIAAIITPPDPFTQTMLAIPLVILYEFSIYIAKVVYRKKAKAMVEEMSSEESKT